MRNKLQYAYSISVLCGVLVTAFMMVSKDHRSNFVYREFQAPSLKSEASLVDPAVSSLIEIEGVLHNLRKDQPAVANTAPDQKRLPTQVKKDTAAR